MAERQYWILVSSPENLRATRERGFTVQGIKSRHRKKAEQMRPGDKLIFYLTGKKVFAATATVTSEYFESDEPIWTSKNTKRDGSPEDYPFRVDIEPELVADESAWIDAEPVARQMIHARKWPEKNWTLAFQGNVHNVPEEDYELIREILQTSIEDAKSAAD
ncbi:MAG TPA: EVE domain-containing protein [Thermomicrobiales bacterium]|nr:EVE domain-containing protein [Thermomicrobiales bacterium]